MAWSLRHTSSRWYIPESPAHSQQYQSSPPRLRRRSHKRIHRWRTYAVRYYHEHDQPLDRAGLTQKYLAAQLRFAFDISKEDLGLSHVKTEPVPNR